MKEAWSKRGLRVGLVFSCCALDHGMSFPCSQKLQEDILVKIPKYWVSGMMHRCIVLSNEIVRFAKVIPPHALSQWFGPLPAFVKWGCLRACKLWFFKIPLLFNFCLCISCQSYQKQVIQCLPHAVYVVSLLVAAFGFGFIHMFIHQPGLWLPFHAHPNHLLEEPLLWEEPP